MSLTKSEKTVSFKKIIYTNSKIIYTFLVTILFFRSFQYILKQTTH
jgi:hypothetical protein